MMQQSASLQRVIRSSAGLNDNTYNIPVQGAVVIQATKFNEHSASLNGVNSSTTRHTNRLTVTFYEMLISSKFVAVMP